ncbi:uncharacterized protein LOC118817027 [Colossoma macropomum]|uniref:uncharacterized protein LOC118817027 n=1 Tax=Colossoma macropomum TaxID=42526 RepID=UPI001864EDDD|nr:uncharacterized protein LOC118817027 [Colossoma macropomum]
MARTALLFCLSFSLVLTSVGAIKTLKNIKYLKKHTNFVKELPRHGLMLLHWFANIVVIDGNGAIQLSFDPGQGSYGLHLYRNMMPDQNVKGRAPSRSESRYYSLGDLSCGRARMLPFYVMQDFHNSKGSQYGNIDRVLIKVQNDSPQRVDKVYITQKSQGTGFDPSKTYEISAQLLIQIRALRKNIACNADDPRLDFSPCEFLNHQQKAAKIEMMYPKAPGLAWFLTLAGYNIDQRSDKFSTLFCSTNISNSNYYPLSTEDNERQCFVHHRIKLEVKSTSTGFARITWSGIPESIARIDINVGLYEDGTKEEPLKECPLNGRTFGSIDTTVPLNPGLQVHLLRSEKTLHYLLFSTTHYTSIWKGPEFDEANGILPTRVRGYDMSLQLYTKDGYACARLYVKKSFINWRNVFDNSWVGFYARSSDDNDKYSKYEWVVNFEKRSEEDCPSDFDIYESESSLDIGPGVQARLMLTNHIASEKARTVPWEERSTFKQ